MEKKGSKIISFWVPQKFIYKIITKWAELKIFQVAPVNSRKSQIRDM